ncbi:hypothetical protein MATR_02900 [Marivirga tractuosa]|jgi:uncharacterized membrane protein|uniref:Membrane protein n=1 Tax=Marivirga tractuosa (strain ATCC 23168 / DSM 4126 / NBRC 15989 / NCIMB 1408 / VKM B-1430 / H-43) TaxID=643867 RepID=E4TUF8_MARTH|nr:hypothetical protein [Marivirga tractuosa]ADR22076.1 membrane protein [Marivirga tractuosa DSM 4126]BDD13465.1 hypothetical protein MATR_02900 [Marivirga tractuosa]
MKKLGLLLYFMLSCIVLSAHEGEKHEKSTKEDSTHLEQPQVDYSHIQAQQEHEHDEHETKKVTADLDDFPNLHPLMVHFPIVLLLIGAVLAIVNVILLKKEVDWVITGMVLVGALGAYLSGRTFHPHTHDLTEHAKQVLAQHDLWADWTIYLSIAGFVAQAVSQFIFRQKRWAVAVVALLLIASGYVVSRTGHYGAQLVHIEAVGPQGKFLESEEGHAH